MHLLEDEDYCISMSKNNHASLGKELKSSDIVIYHVDKNEHLWVPEIISISYRVKVVFITSSSHLIMASISNIVAIIDENASLELIISTIKKNNSCPPPTRKEKVSLTKREHEVLVKSVNNMSPYVIAQTLRISIKTVYAHRKSAYKKLGARTICNILSHRGNRLK